MSNDIKGYRQLADHEIELINYFKKVEKDILVNISTHLENSFHLMPIMRPVTAIRLPELMPEAELFKPDPRWLAIGKTHIEQGFMALVRSIAKPE